MATQVGVSMQLAPEPTTILQQGCDPMMAICYCGAIMNASHLCLFALWSIISIMSLVALALLKRGHTFHVDV